MAFVSIHRDLSAVKTRILLNMTRRQLICFGTAAAIGIPIYIFTRGTIGNMGAALLMIAAMLPLFFLGIYEKDGMAAEKILRNVIRTRFAWPGKRPYKTENFYEILEMEGKSIAAESKTAAKTPVGKRPSGKVKQGGREKVRAKRTQ